MAGRRHHTIPKFLLNGFASSRRGDEVNVWMYRKEADGIEVNTRNVSVEKDFYGKAEETELDKRITEMESEFSVLVDTLRRADVASTTELSDDRIASLIAHLALRTRQFRQSVSFASETMFRFLENHLGQRENLAPMLKRELVQNGRVRDSFGSLLIEHGLPAEQLDTAMQLLEPHWSQIAENAVELFSGEFLQYFVKEQFATFKALMPEALKQGYIDSMSKNLGLEGRADVYRKFKWFVVRVESALILGDTVCLFETISSRRFKPLDDNGDHLHRIYLPLNSKVLLVGTPTSVRPIVDPNTINKAAARCSYEFFISSCQLPVRSHLTGAIGSWSGLLGKKDMAVLIKETRQALLE